MPQRVSLFSALHPHSHMWGVCLFIQHSRTLAGLFDVVSSLPAPWKAKIRGVASHALGTPTGSLGQAGPPGLGRCGMQTGDSGAAALCHVSPGPKLSPQV